jgi:DNA-binding PadR family transcriptional regulator
MRLAVRRPRQSIHDPAPSEANTDAGAGEKAILTYVSSRDIESRCMAAGKTPLLNSYLGPKGDWLPPAFARVGQASPEPPLRIDIKFPILGFLMDSEMTGYDLKRRFQDAIGFFYRVSDGSLYPALKKLARDGLVTMRTERRGRRARKIYAITPTGRERFLRMLAEPSPPVFVHDEAQVKIYFAHHDPNVALAHMERMRRFDELWAQQLSSLVDEMKSRGENPFRKAVVEIGRQLTAFKAKMMARLQAEMAREMGITQPLKRQAGPKAIRAAAGNR